MGQRRTAPMGDPTARSLSRSRDYERLRSPALVTKPKGRPWWSSEVGSNRPSVGGEPMTGWRRFGSPRRAARVPSLGGGGGAWHGADAGRLERLGRVDRDFDRHRRAYHRSLRVCPGSGRPQRTYPDLQPGWGHRPRLIERHRPAAGVLPPGRQSVSLVTAHGPSVRVVRVQVSLLQPWQAPTIW